MFSKKVMVVVGVVIFLIATAVSYYSFGRVSSKSGGVTSLFYRPPTTNGSNTATQADTEPKTEECPINGEYYSKTQKAKWDKRRPLGVMVENHKESRPQSGLSGADVIYEAVAEGGITRTLAVFFCKEAPYIGPVRSARIYFLKLLQGYGDHPLYAHVGGANAAGPADALGEISDLGWDNYNDLNQFSVPFPNYWRDYERLPGVATEHTVYSTPSKLWDYAVAKRKLSNVNEKGKKWNAAFTPWKFKDDAKNESRGVVGKISFGFWTLFSSDYSVVWTYDKTTNNYKRENGGSPHLDKNTGKQLAAKNVVVVFADESPVNDDYGGHLFYDIVGAGTGLVFQDGKAIKITWKKPKEEAQIRFYDESGKELELVRGQVFVEVLPTGNKVTY